MGMDFVPAESGASNAHVMPDALEPIVYLLQDCNTPRWLWIIRAAVVAAFLLAMLVYWHYRSKRN